MKLPRDLSGEELIKHLCKRSEYEFTKSAATSFFRLSSRLIIELPVRHIRLCVSEH